MKNLMNRNLICFVLLIGAVIIANSVLIGNGTNELVRNSTSNDFDKDGVPDDKDIFPYDFNNDGIYDAHTYQDYDGDGIMEYPYGYDFWLNTTIPTTFPDPWGGQCITFYIGEFTVNPAKNLTAEPQVNMITLTWNAVLGTDVLGYNLYKSEVSGYNYSKINDEVIINTTFIDVDVIDGVTYFYVLKTVNQTGFESRQSMEASATLLADGDLTYTSILGIVIVIIVASIVIIFLWRRKKKTDIEKPPLPGEEAK